MDEFFATQKERAAYEAWKAEQEKDLGPDDDGPDTSEDAYIDMLLTSDDG